MHIEMEAESIPLTDVIRRHIINRLLFTLSAHDEKIKNIKVLISNIDISLRGTDKRCQIQVVLHQLPDVVIEDEEVDLYLAIDRAVDRASRAVDRRLNRDRDRCHAANSSKFLAPIELGDSPKKIH